MQICNCNIWKAAKGDASLKPGAHSNSNVVKYTMNKQSHTKSKQRIDIEDS